MWQAAISWISGKESSWKATYSGGLSEPYAEMECVFVLLDEERLNRLEKMKKSEKQSADSILWGMALRTYPPGEKSRIHIRFGRIGIYLLGLLVGGWIVTSAGLYFYFKSGFRFTSHVEKGTDLGWKEVSYWKMLALPFRLDEHRKELGDFYLQKAEESIKAKEMRSALDLLRLGVTLSPSNLRGRRILSEFFDYGFKQPDDAANILVAGVKRGGHKDPEYMSHVFRFLLHHEYDEKVIELGEDLLNEDKIEIDTISQMTALATATSFYNLSKFNRAKSYINKYALHDSPEAIILLADMHWKKGEQREAFGLLEQSSKRFPYSSRVYLKISEYQLELGEARKALRTIVLAQVANPENLDLAIKVLELQHKDNQKERFDNSFKEVLEYFAEDKESCLKLAETLADLGLGEYGKQVELRANQMGLQDPQYSLATLRGYLQGGKFLEAEDLANRLLRKSGTWEKGYQHTLLIGFKAMTQFGLQDFDGGNGQLREFFRAELELPPVEKIHQLAKLFQKQDFISQAREVLLHAKEQFPSYRPVLEDLVRIDLETRNFTKLPGSIRDMLGSRRKKVEILIDCQKMLASDFFLFYPEQKELLNSLSNTLQNIREQGALPRS